MPLMEFGIAQRPTAKRLAAETDAMWASGGTRYNKSVATFDRDVGKNSRSCDSRNGGSTGRPKRLRPTTIPVSAQGLRIIVVWLVLVAEILPTRMLALQHSQRPPTLSLQGGNHVVSHRPFLVSKTTASNPEGPGAAGRIRDVDALESWRPNLDRHCGFWDATLLPSSRPTVK